MHKYTVDLLNTLDEYRMRNITYSHKDPLIKEKVSNRQFGLFNCLYIPIFFIAVFVSNMVLMFNAVMSKILLVSLYQFLIMLFIFIVVYSIHEVLRFRKIYEDVRITGSDYLEQVKDYFFYNPEVYNYILTDVEPFFVKLKDYQKFQENLEKNKITTIELFEVYKVIHHEYSKRQKYINKIIKKSDFLENLKRIRRKELQEIDKAEQDAKDLRKYFAEQSYSDKN